jgi:serpin B
MTYAGAQGDTAAHMAKALHFNIQNDRIHAAFADLGEKVQSSDLTNLLSLHFANSLWCQKDYRLNTPFLETLRTHYKAHLQQVDYVRDAEAVRDTINHWVKENTDNKILECIPRGSINGNTRLLLANAIYFRAAWNTPFPKDNTTEGMFELDSGRRIPAQIMHLERSQLNYCSLATYDLLELPYKGRRFSMLILLPRMKQSLLEVEKSINCANLHKDLQNLSLHEVDLFLPRFKVQFSTDLSHEDFPLGFMRQASFDGIASGLRVSMVVHKAMIEVDEVGTEAAATTAVLFPLAERPLAVFDARRPFLFFLRDMTTNSILFIGRLSDPSL